MSTHTSSDQLDPKVEECLHMHKCWPWFLGLGVVLIAAGAIAVGSIYVAALTTFAMVILFGCLLLAGGVVQIVNAFLARTWRGFFIYLLGGILHLILGGLADQRSVRTGRSLEPPGVRRQVRVRAQRQGAGLCVLGQVKSGKRRSGDVAGRVTAGAGGNQREGGAEAGEGQAEIRKPGGPTASGLVADRQVGQSASSASV